MNQGPYCFNSADLYLRVWVERFNPDKEDLSWALVWIRMYSLLAEYWDEDSLKDIGNGLGEYVKSADTPPTPVFVSSCVWTNPSRTR